MAFQPNIKSGKAVADIEALYFLKHTSGEPAMSDALDKSNAKSSEWFPVLTQKGTVTASQDAPSLEKIAVDQFDAAIGTTSEPGDFNFEALLPKLDKAAIREWLGADAVEETGLAIEGRELVGFDLDGKLMDMSVLIKTKTGETIVFPHVQISLSFTKEDKVFEFRVNGQVLAPTNSNNHMVYVAVDQASAPSSVSLSKSTTSIAVDASETLTASVSPAGSDDRVVWSSSDTSKATVDQNGKVTGVAAASGQNAPKIRATSVADSTKYAECTVTVTAGA